MADIGIPSKVTLQISPLTYENGPELWFATYPWPRPDGHKYERGHALIYGGTEFTGASRLTARGAMRIGAGLVTVALFRH